MKVVSIGSRYELYEDTLRTFDQLPAKVYSVCFSKLTGFYLEEHPSFIIGEKVYGVHKEKVDKVFQAYRVFERSLGVILSGDKGIGKSLFAKMLGIRAVSEGVPVILVNKAYPGIEAYLESIEQEVLFLFDEFDKTFKERDDTEDPQAALLSLFDGMAQGKKLFVVTCNEIRQLNDYLVNRPGRFHYHFRFGYPTGDEIREYLKDKLQVYREDEVERVVAFSRRVDLNYDCLRAIAFELNTGSTFNDAIQDLNILNLDSYQYNCILRFNNGVTRSRNNVSLNLFDSSEMESFWIANDTGRHDCFIEFSPVGCQFDPQRGVLFIPGSAVRVDWDDDAMEELGLVPEVLELVRVASPTYRYTV